MTASGRLRHPSMRTAVRTIAPPKLEKGGDCRLPAVVSVRIKSLVEGIIGNELSRPVSDGKCPGQNWGSRGRRFKSGQPDQKTPGRRGSGFGHKGAIHPREHQRVLTGVRCQQDQKV